jgi:uncharacterized membrane protein YjjP (DUF1212 family)
MNPVAKSWKTTALGVTGLVSALAFAFTQYLNGGFAAVNFEVLIAAVLGSTGLIFAKDAGVSNAPNPGPAVKVPPSA